MQGCWRQSVQAAILITLLGVGCKQVAPLDAPPVVHNFQPSDFPVPFNFDLDEKKSWAYIEYMEGPLQFRSLELTYWGQRPPLEVANWYLEQMPLHGWKQVRSDQHQGIHLAFEKGDEEAMINLKKSVDRYGKFHITKLQARIGVR